MNNEYHMSDPKIYNLGVLEEKSYSFALRIIKAHKYLINQNEYTLSKQFFKSIHADGLEILKLLISIIKTSKSNLSKNSH